LVEASKGKILEPEVQSMLCYCIKEQL